MHAPVVGPASWAPVARELAGSGHRVTVPVLSGFWSDGPPYAQSLVRRAGRQLPEPGGEHIVIAVHSGAGVFAPYLAEAVLASGADGGTVTVVFVDAAVPPQSGDVTVVDSDFLPVLRDMADDGVVPPWPLWWPQEVMAELIPDQETRRSVVAEAPALPLAFFEETLPAVPESWQSCRPAYLRLSAGYQQPASEAASRGWPVRELPGDHLHMCVEPAAVAAVLLDLAAAATA